ncbi:hypothetical protein QWY99_21345 [Flavobacterium branchiarum]|uniref:Uncharacterized protein n=1 Tax=Flavobacterium branchiarum TaxID=1114870 RepID=A0ABV5FPN8_9FLAO|nr:hypothetical protein [Flavobacterium branchiarum]MDN3675581.1 hypothetical protein [Flavobacterium branchiarum]
MKTIYYYYYLFYIKISKDDEPYATTVFALSMSEGFVINFILNIISIHQYCYLIDKWIMIIVQLVVLIINYLFFNKSGKAIEITKEKPMFFFNHKLSVITTLLFFIITLSFMFWGPIYTKYLLETYCGS